MKRHVYLFNEGSRASVYGIGTYIRQMMDCLKMIQGIELHVVHLKTNVDYFEKKVEDEYDIYNIPSIYLPAKEKGERYYRNICYLMRLYIRFSEQDRHIFIFNYTAQLPLVARVKESFPGCLVYYTIHYQDWCFELNGDLARFKSIIHAQDVEALLPSEKHIYESYVREKELYQSVDKVICLSKFTQRLLLEEYGMPQDKLTLIYNGLKDEGRELSRNKRNALKRLYHFSPKEKIILFVGRLDPIKGVKILVMAFQDLLEKSPDCRLVIVGDGDYSSCLSECQTNWKKVTFTGRLKKEKLYDFYQIADIGVMPSMHEQCSYVAIEMMMFGMPMVISTTTGLKEMMQDQDFGYTFNMKSEGEAVRKELADLILNVLTASTESKTKMEYLSRYQYEKEYSETKMQKAYLNLLTSEPDK